MPEPELTNTTWPPALRNAGSSGSVSATGPITFTVMVSRHSSTVDSATVAG